jgi:hypothetical protein
MIAPISSNSFANESAPSTQNPQQNFSTLLQQIQSGQLSSQTALPPVPRQGGTPAQHIVDGSKSSSQHTHWRHHTPRGSQTDDNSASGSSSSFGELSQPVQATTTSTAQQAYGNLQQDLQQVALNSDLLNAQTTFLQDSALSVSA